MTRSDLHVGKHADVGSGDPGRERLWESQSGLSTSSDPVSEREAP